MKNRKLILAVIALIAVIALLACVYIFTRPQPQQGAKEITVTVVHKDQAKQQTYTYHTDEEYLDKVLLAEGLIKGYEDQYGLVIEEVDGEKASWEDGVFWALYIGQEQATTGISQVVVTDGGVYSLVYEAFTW